MNTTPEPFRTVAVKESTKRKFDQIAEAKRWTLATTADEAAEALAQREGIDLKSDDTDAAA